MFDLLYDILCMVFLLREITVHQTACNISHSTHQSICAMFKYWCFNEVLLSKSEDVAEGRGSVFIGVWRLVLRRERGYNEDCIRSVKTLGSWKKRMKEARTTVKKAYKKLKPFEDAMYAELDEYEKKLDARFKARNAKLIEEIATARAMAGRATGSWRATRTRIAKKHGYVCRP